MNRQQALERAIDLAIEGGWPHPDEESTSFEFKTWDNLQTIVRVSSFNPNEDSFGYMLYTINDIIFNHDFAKALWGEFQATTHEDHNIPAKWPHASDLLGYKDYQHIPEGLLHCLNCGEHWRHCNPPFIENAYPCNLIEPGNIGWQFHLQQMVIAEDPIEYLGQNLPTRVEGLSNEPQTEARASPEGEN